MNDLFKSIHKAKVEYYLFQIAAFYSRLLFPCVPLSPYPNWRSDLGNEPGLQGGNQLQLGGGQEGRVMSWESEQGSTHG